MDAKELLHGLEQGDDGDLGATASEVLKSVVNRFGAKPEGFLLITEETAALRYQPGDLVAFSRQREPQDGDGVVARIDGVLRLGIYRENDGAKEVRVEDRASGTTEANGNKTSAEEAEVEVVASVVGGIITTGRVGDPGANQVAVGEQQ